MTETIDPKQLARQLTPLAMKLVHGDDVLDVIGWGVSADTSLVQTIVRNTQADFDTSPREALKEALRRAIKNLGAERYEGEAITFRYAADLLFGFTKVPEPDHGTWYDAVVAEVVSSCRPMTKHGRNELTKRVRTRVAIELLELETEQLHQHDPHISRPNLEQQIRELLTGHARAVALWGESGNGKSYLARQVARQLYNDEHVIILKGPFGVNLSPDRLDVDDALRKLGIEDYPPGHGQLVLRRMLSSPGKTMLLILDNADYKMVETYTGDSITAKVLITCRTDQRWPDVEYRRVDEFDSFEARRYLADVVVDQPEHRVDEICGFVGKRALALFLLRRVLQRTEVTFNELHSACAEDAAASIEAYVDLAGEPASLSLKRVYGYLVDELESDKQAAYLLDGILWLTGGASSISRLFALTIRERQSAVSVHVWRAALGRLAELGFITVSAGDFTINDLSLALLQSLRRSSFAPMMEILNKLIIEDAETIETRVSAKAASNALAGSDFEAVRKGLQIQIRYLHHIAEIWGVELQSLALSVSDSSYVMSLPSTSKAVEFRQPGQLGMLVTAGETRVRVFDADGVSIAEDDTTSQHILSLCALHTLAADSVLREIGANPDTNDEYADLQFPQMIPVDENDTVVHRSTTLIPEAIWDLANQPTWARCGALYFPTSGATGELCEDCLHADDSLATITDTRPISWQLLGPALDALLPELGQPDWKLASLRGIAAYLSSRSHKGAVLALDSAVKSTYDAGDDEKQEAATMRAWYHCLRILHFEYIDGLMHQWRQIVPAMNEAVEASNLPREEQLFIWQTVVFPLAQRGAADPTVWSES